MPNQREARAALQRRTDETKGTAVTQADERPPPSINEQLAKPQVQEQIRMALAGMMDPARFTRIVLTAVHGSPALQQCSFQSLVGAALQSAQLGLEPNTPLQQAALVPYKGKASFQLQYKGLLTLAYRSDRIKSISATVVYEADEYKVWRGTNPEILHQPHLGSDRGKAVYWYAVARLAGDAVEFVHLNRDDVEYHRSFSKQPNGPAWKNSYNAMGQKSALIELHKFLPMAVELSTGVAVDESVQEEWRPNMAEHYAAEHAEDQVAPTREELEPPEPEDEIGTCEICGGTGGEHADGCSARPFDESIDAADGEIVSES